MNYQSLKEYGSGILREAGIENSEYDAFYLIEYLTGITRTEFLLKKNETVPDDITEEYNRLIKRRAGHEPLQYITKEAWFMGLRFGVSEDVLIPRQDTEILAECAIELIKDLPEGLKVLDLCTGSGAIAAAIKHYVPDAKVTAIDISEAALEMAALNAKANQADVEFVLSDMFNRLEGRRFDVIVSNPPYVTESEYAGLMPEVRDHEPKGALIAGEDGLDFYRKIADEAWKYMSERAYLILETGCSQAEDVRSLFEERFENIEVIRDLAGLDRVVKMQLKSI